MLVRKREVFGSDASEVLAILKWARQTAGLTRAELSRRLKVSQSTVQQYDEGKRPKPGWVFMIRWLRACDCRVVIDGDPRS